VNVRYAATTALFGVVILMSGCTTPPAPVETSPAFSTEEEAFAAAEATYRAYVDALNQVDLSDPGTFEPVFALTTGDARSGLRESFTQMHGDEWNVSGESVATVIEPSDASATEAKLAICLDVSRVSVTDSSGASVVDPDRVAVQSMLVNVLFDAGLDGNHQISSFEGREGEPACGTESG